VGQLETSRFGHHRPGESPLFIAEQLAFHEVFRNGRTVDLDEGVAFPRAVDVDGVGDEFLARSRLTGDENGGRRRGHPFDGLEDLLHRLAGADDAVAVDVVGAGDKLLVA